MPTWDVYTRVMYTRVMYTQDMYTWDVLMRVVYTRDVYTWGVYSQDVCTQVVYTRGTRIPGSCSLWAWRMCSIAQLDSTILSFLRICEKLECHRDVKA